MNIFKFRDQLIDEYRSYVASFINIADPLIVWKVDGALYGGALWPEPLLQLNPISLPAGHDRRASSRDPASFRVHQILGKQIPHLNFLR